MFVRLKALLVGVALSFYIAIPATADTDAILQMFPNAVVGDFNGDGLADALVPASPSQPAGIYMGGSSGSLGRVQDLPAGYLGLNWAVPDAIVYSGDFNGDGRDDLYVQAHDATQASAILFADPAGRFSQRSVEIDPLHLGLGWTADRSTLSVGDFDGDGRADVLVRSNDGLSVHTDVLNDGAGTPAFGPQAWPDGYLGRTWRANAVAAYAGDFNGDQRADLLLQVTDDALIDGYPGEAAYALVLADDGGVFTAVADSWDRDALGAEWDPATHSLRVGDIDGDGIADLVLRARDGSGMNYLMLGSPRGFHEVAAKWRGSATARDAYLQAQQSLLDMQQMQSGALLESPQGKTLDETQPTMQTMSFTAGTPAVGALAGEAGVSGGAASYSIPIVVPPGRAGVQPAISVGYSSRAGNGELGMGWSLGVGSSIGRCGQSAAIDNETNLGVTFTGTDRLCLDGQRLILISGSYGASGAVYRTELESFVRVEQSGAGFSGPSSKFLVRHNDGRIAYYGQDAQSVFVPRNGTAPQSWLLSRTEDAYGNSIIFTYDRSVSGEHHIASVAYTGTGTTAGNRSVAFTWEDRPDLSNAWLSGTETVQTKRLQMIHTAVAGSTVREYRFSYPELSTSTGRSLLGSVEECAYALAELVCLPATTFAWQKPAPAFAKPGWTTKAQYQAEYEEQDTSDQKAVRVFVDGDPAPMPMAEGIASVGSWIGLTEYSALPSAAFIGRGRREFGHDRSGDTAMLRMQKDGPPVAMPAPVGGWPSVAPVDWAQAVDNTDRFVDMNVDGKVDYFADGVIRSYDGATWRTITTSVAGGGPIDGWDLKVADFTGDGKPDVLGVTFIGSSTTNRHVVLWRNSTPDLDPSNLTTMTFAAPVEVWNPAEIDQGWITTGVELVRVIDFDGDGRPDVLARLDDYVDAPGPVNRLLLNRSVDESINFVTDFSPTLDADDSYLWADVNGDGLEDLFVKGVGSNDTTPWKLRLNKGGTLAAAVDLGLTTLGTARFATRTGDVDNDGREELLLPGARVATFCMANQTYWGRFTDDSGDDEQWIEEDLCGRRLLQKMPQNAQFDASIYNYTALRIVIAADGAISTADTGVRFNAPGTGFSFGDVDGDGLNDLSWSVNRDYGVMFYANGTDPDIILGPGDGVGYKFPGYGNYLSVQTAAAPDLMTQVTDGLAREAKWTYFPLGIEQEEVDSEDAELSGGTQFYSIPDSDGYADDHNFYFTSSMYAVAKFETTHHGECTAPCSAWNERRYAYAEAMYNNEGRGFQGFRTIVEEDTARGIRSTTTFHQKYPLSGQVEAATTELIAGHKVISTVANTWVEANPIDALTKQARLELSTSGRRDPIADIEVSRTVSDPVYSGACTASSVENTTDQFTATNARVVTTTNVYNANQNNSSWLWCQLANRTTSTQVNTAVRHLQAATNDTKTLVNTFTYNAQRKPVTESVESGSGGSLKRTTTYGYNAYGNVTGVSVSGGLGPTFVSPRASSMDYSADGYFPWHVNTMSGEHITSLVDPKHGQPTQVTDTIGVDSYFGYDAFGRKLTSQVENLPVQTLSYTLCSGCTPTAKYTITATQAGQPTVTTTYDALNRAIATATQGFGVSQTVYTALSYDAKGRVAWQSEPGFDTTFGPSELTTFVYDAIDRVEIKSDPKGLVTTNEYSGGIVTVEAEGDGITQTATQETNAAGQLLTAIDGNGNMTHFRYDALGNPVRIVDAIGAVVTAGYNGLGQKTSLNDADLGAWTYAYNVLGELLSQTDARTKTTTFGYDNKGRMITRVEPETSGSCTTTWTYDTAVNGLGKLASVAQCDGYAELYAYDSLGRVTNVSTTLSGYSYDMSTSYDSFGRVDTLWYPLRTAPVALPGAPVNLWSEPADPVLSLDGNATIGWQAPTSGGTPTRYEAFRRKGTGAWTGPIVTTPGVTTLNYSGLANFTHEFKVRACNGSGCGPDSASVFVTVCTSGACGGGGGQRQAAKQPGGGGGGVSTMSLPTRFGVKQVYNAQGYLYQVQDANTFLPYWTANDLNAYGAIKNETHGNGPGAVISSREFMSNTPFVSEIKAGGISRQNLSYSWNAFGQLTNRSDLNLAVSETFTYDALNRVRTGSLTLGGTGPVTTLDVTYDATGNILSKLDTSGTKTYVYPAFNAAHPHAVTSATGTGNGTGAFVYDANGNMITRGTGNNQTWSVANLPLSLTSGSYSSVFSYGPARNRYKQVGSYSGRTETTWQVGSLYERMSKTGSTTIEYRYQVTAGGMPVARVTEKSDDTSRTQYMLRDHLGSIDTILNEDGSVSAKTSFDAHGSRRAADATQGTVWQSKLLYTLAAVTIDGLRDKTTRGFTDHEMLDNVGLVHMNGRVYDPALGRFLSVDPVFQFPTNTQSLNPYTYVLNSPLTMTDPTGLASAAANTCGAGDGDSAVVCSATMTTLGGESFSAVTTNGQTVGAQSKEGTTANGSPASGKTATFTPGVDSAASKPEGIESQPNKGEDTPISKGVDKAMFKVDKSSGGTGRDRHEGKEGFRHIDDDSLPGDPAVITIRNDNSKLADPDHAVKSTVADAIETVGSETGHDVNVNSTVREGGDGAHPDGRGADMNRVNKKPVIDASTDPAVRAAVDDVVNSLMRQPGVNQVIGPTGGWNKSGNEWKPITDQNLLNEHFNHIHFGVD